MSDTSLEQTESIPPGQGNTVEEPGTFEIMQETDAPTVKAPTLPTRGAPVPSTAFKRSNRPATVEHLAARRAITPVDAEAPEVKQKLSDLRAELTTLVTDLRWGGYSVQATVEILTPLLDIGPLAQWIPVLIPTMLEIDRAGNLVPPGPGWPRRKTRLICQKTPTLPRRPPGGRAAPPCSCWAIINPLNFPCCWASWRPIHIRPSMQRNRW